MSFPSKYHAKKVTVNGITFDSKKEADRYKVLSMLEQVGHIKDLKRQVKFELIPSQKVDGKVVERPCTYVADFTYYKGYDYIVEDVKGFKTPEYVIKRKLLLYTHGIRITEI